MARSRQRILPGIIILVIILSCSAPNAAAAAWSTGLNVLIAIAPAENEDLGALLTQVNRLQALTTASDRVAIVAGSSDSQKISLSEQRPVDEMTLAGLVQQPSKQPGLITPKELFAMAVAHFAESSEIGLQPVLVFLDRQGLMMKDDDPELTDLLEQLVHSRCLIAGIGTGARSELGRMLEGCGGLAFTPENEAAEHRAMVDLLAGARACSRLPLVNGYLPVDASCQQLSLLLTGQGLPQVVRPNGSILELDGDNLLCTKDGSGVTITIASPEAGYWRVLGDGWSGGAILVSPLRLGHMPILATHPVGEPIRLLAYLADGDRLSPDPYPYALEITAELLGPSQLAEKIPFYDDGQHGDGAAGDGLYGTETQLNVHGSYQLKYELERGLLVREESVSFRVAEPDGQERQYTLSQEAIDLPRLVPGRAYQQTITLTSHLATAERFRFDMGDDDTDLRSFGELVVSPSEVELQPGEKRTVTLTVRLQPKAALGGYAGHLRLVPVSAAQRGQIVPLRLRLVPWPIANWPWLAAGGAGLFAAMLTAGMVLSKPQLHGWLSNEALGGRERVLLHGYHFLPSPTSHRSYLVAARSGGFIRVQLCIDRDDPPVLLNGLPVSKNSPLSDGDQLRFGQVIWEFREGVPESIQEPAATQNPPSE
ncbi:MAG: choice-of-anchor X domain-containing protein [Bacillota bacterium]